MNQIALMNMIRPATDAAVTAAMHRADVATDTWPWHKQRGITAKSCPLCQELVSERVTKTYDVITIKTDGNPHLSTVTVNVSQ